MKIGHDLLVLLSRRCEYMMMVRLLLCLHADKEIWSPGVDRVGRIARRCRCPRNMGRKRRVWVTAFPASMAARLVIDYANGDKAAYIGTIFRGRIRCTTARRR